MHPTTALSEQPNPIPHYTALPLYKCHKLVRATKILEVDPAGHVLVNPSLDAQPYNAWPVEVGMGWIERHKPNVGDYIVVYADGYCSCSPPAAFEAGYTLMEPEAAPAEEAPPPINDTVAVVPPEVPFKSPGIKMEGKWLDHDAQNAVIRHYMLGYQAHLKTRMTQVMVALSAMGIEHTPEQWAQVADVRRPDPALPPPFDVTVAEELYAARLVRERVNHLQIAEIVRQGYRADAVAVALSRHAAVYSMYESESMGQLVISYNS